MKYFIQNLESEFKKEANPQIAAGQKSYMKNQFEFFGIKSPRRREIQKPFLLKEMLPPKTNLDDLIKICWNKNEREYQYFAQELAYKYVRQSEKQDIRLFEYMLTHKSWWDTVDFIAVKLVGNYFKHYPNLRDKELNRWIDSGHMWLQRSALLYQLKYKDQVDTDFLTYAIQSLSASKEFFIRKAIGWVLREYSRTNPEWVLNFCTQENVHYTLSPLSRKEALRLIL
jgi:3-methyladenine DNA glycosylase AlkD